MQAVIHFDSAGNAKALWTDALPLSALGKLSVTRASSVEFNADDQLWEVTLNGDIHPSFRHPSREVCIAWEVETLNQRLLQS